MVQEATARKRTAIRTCPLCEATCGLELELEGDRVVVVRGDRQDVLGRGHLCPKGASFGDLEADPDRLSAPRIRRDGRLVEVTWEEAYDEVAGRLLPITEEHGPDAVAIYVGNPNVHNLAGQLYVRPLVEALRTRNVYTASSVDQLPKHVSCGHVFGDPLAVPVPDVDRTDLLVVLGGNPPGVSNGSLWTAPDLPGRLTALRRRGGPLIVVDPRRTRTAARADEHLAIRPGTDALLLAAVVRTLFEEDLADVGDHLRDHVAGIDEVERLLAPFVPERVTLACDVDAATIRRLAHDLAAADRACVYGRLGTTTVRFGTVASWLVDVCNVLTGNLDRPGGAMFPRPAHHRPRRRPFHAGRWHSRVRGLPEVMGELPVVSTPDGARLDAAIRSLDLVVAVDPYVTAITRHADAFVLRRAVESVVADPDARLATRDPDEIVASLDGGRGPLRLLDLLVRAGPYGEGFGLDPGGLSLALLERRPHGIDLGPLEPRVPEILRTGSGRIEVAPEAITADLPHLEAALADGPTHGLVLVGRRHLRTNNSWGQSVAAVVSDRELCTLQVHPDDADARGLAHGGRARVTSRTGGVVVTVEVTDDLRPGVVSLPHGFGHDLDGVELPVARDHPGVNANRSTDRQSFDPVSGTAVLNGVPVEVAPA